MSPRPTKESRKGMWEGHEGRHRDFHEQLGRIREVHGNSRKDVEFKKGGAGIAVAGILGGVLFGLGATWIVLSQGAALGPKVQTTLVIVALALGGVAVLTSAFFGLVIPHHVSREPGDWKDCCGKGE
jgi:hypothetical protein